MIDWLSLVHSSVKQIANTQELFRLPSSNFLSQMHSSVLLKPLLILKNLLSGLLEFLGTEAARHLAIGTRGLPVEIDLFGHLNPGQHSVVVRVILFVSEEVVFVNCLFSR